MDGGPDVQLPEHRIGARQRGLARNDAGGIVHVPEMDGGGRAGLLAGRPALSILDVPALPPGFEAGLLDPLDAQGAFFHHSPASDGDVRIQDHVLKAVLVGVVEPVEAPNLVGAVVGAEPGPHAAVVDLLVESFPAVDRGQDRTDRFAGSVVAVLAHHGLVHRADVPALARVVAVDPDPGHLPVAFHFVLADHGNIVLGLAADDAGRAPGAGGEVHHHPPVMSLVRVVILPERRLLFSALLGNGLRWPRRIRDQGGLPDGFPDFPARRSEVLGNVERMVVLGAGQIRAAPGLLHLDETPFAAKCAVLPSQEGGGIPSHGRTGRQRVLSFPPLRADLGDAVGPLAPVSQGHRDNPVVLARLEEGRQFEVRLAVFRHQPDHVALADVQGAGRFDGKADVVVPDRLGHRIGKFLEPGVVRVGSVADPNLGIEDEGESVLCSGGPRRDRLDGGGLELERLPASLRLPFDETRLDSPVEEQAEGILRPHFRVDRLLPVLAQDLQVLAGAPGPGFQGRA